MNIKELFSKDKFNKKKFVEFFDKKGFYIVLVLCIVIVGATAVFVTTRNMSLSDKDEKDRVVSNTKDAKTTMDASSRAVAQSSTDTTKEAVGKAVNDTQKGTQSSNPGSVANKDTTKNANAAEVVKNTQATQSAPKSTTPTNPGFELPVFGQITYDFSNDKLSYSKTLDHWMTHEGIDIASDRGSQVKAVADGIISDIKSDPRLGIIVIIDHQNGYKTKYGNLAADDMVTVNQKIKQGEVIGSVGSSALFEISEAPHLHFEVMKNEVVVDPKTFLPKN